MSTEYLARHLHYTAGQKICDRTVTEQTNRDRSNSLPIYFKLVVLKNFETFTR